MGHVLIAYDIVVIMIGLSALSIAGFWVLKTKEAYLVNFSILYACYTASMLISVLEKYSFLNIVNFKYWYGYLLSGINLLFGFAIVIAGIHFFHGVYRIKYSKVLTLISLLVGILSLSLTVSPIGAVLHSNEIRFEIGALIGFGLYNLVFTYLLVVGYAFIGRVWKTNQRTFVTGLLLFATVGYIDGLVSYIQILRDPVVDVTAQGGFLYSSIPYALYGIFVIFYFFQYTFPFAVSQEFREDIIARYGITEREHEIIRKVIQGKSNAAIAAELFISPATVKTHLNNIYKKMNLGGRFDLITRIRNG